MSALHALESFHARCRQHRALLAVLGLAWFASAAAYLGWRTTVFNPHAAWFSVAFFAAESFGFLSVGASLLTFWAVRERVPGAAVPGLAVDVLIPTYNEPLDVIRRTARAARHMRYPHETWILDDGNRANVRALAESLGCRYLARADNRHAKAGNLNHALGYACGEFVAILDADHVPEAHFLETLLGYFDDPDLAFVQSPQDYVNIDSFQFRNSTRHGVTWHDQTLFYRLGQAGRDRWNAATFCGTSSVVRRSALDAVGGFATETVTEDMHTAVRMHRRGWKSAFHPVALAYGTAATSYVEFLAQRLRWGHGNVQTLREERLPFGPGLSAAQRLSHTLLGLSYFEGWARLVLYLTPAMVLLTSVAPIGNTHLFFWFFVPYFAATVLAIDAFGRGWARFVENEKMAMARFPVSILATFGLVRDRTRWRITSKERDGRVPGYLVLPQIAIGVISFIAMVVGVVEPPRGLVATLSGGTVAVIVCWAGLTAALAFGAVARVMHDERRRAAAFLFTVPLPLAVAARGGTAAHTVTTALGADAIVFEFAARHGGGPGVSPGSSLEVELHAPGATFHGEATVERISHHRSWFARRSRRFHCRVRWHHADSRESLDALLHACGWHRALVWPCDWTPTWVDRLGALFGAGAPGTPRGEWRPLRYETEGAETAARLGLIRDDGDGDLEAIVFDSVAPGAAIVLRSTDDGARCFERGGDPVLLAAHPTPVARLKVRRRSRTAPTRSSNPLADTR